MKQFMLGLGRIGSRAARGAAGLVRKRWMRRLLVSAAVLLVLLGAALGYAWRQMALADLRHAAFCECGTGIKSFLKEYAHALEEAAAHGDATPLLAFYADDYHSPARGQWQFVSSSDIGDAHLSRLQARGDQAYRHEDVLRELHEYLAGIRQVDHVVCKIGLIEEAQPDQWAVLTVKYVMDGRDAADRLFQDRFFFRWHLRLLPDEEGIGQWRIERDELVEGVRAAGSGKAFERLDPQVVGVDYVHHRDPHLDKTQVPLKFAVIEHASGGVSVVDYDDDGRADLFFADGQRCRLYRNISPPASGGVAFQDVTSEVGLGVVGQTHSALFVDFDNDGDKDLFLTRYFAPCKYYRHEQGRFVDAGEEMGLELVVPAVSSCVLDYDLDGYLDIYVGVNGNAFKEAPNIPFYATNAEPDRLLRNVEGRRFADVSREAGIENTGWTLAVTAGDYNCDGYPDVSVANDFGRKVLYHNNGDKTFSDRAKEAGSLDFSGGMGAAFADLNGDEYPDMLFSDIESGQRWFGEEITLWQYIRNVSRTKWIFDELDDYRELYGLVGSGWRELGKEVGEGNSVFCNRRDGTFEEWKDCHATRAGWAWSVNPLDFDNDGDLDIYVANGWISSKLKDDL